MQRTRAFRLGRPVGFALLVHGSWLPAGALLLVHLSVSAFGGLNLVPALAWSLFTVAAFFVCVVAHELFQGLVSRIVGSPYVDSTLFLFGGVPRLSREPSRPVGEVIAALAGPGASGAIGYGLLTWSRSLDGSFSNAIHLLALANLALAAANVLPALPLDGGRLVAAIGWARTGRRSRGAKIAGHLGQFLGFAGIIAGIWLLSLRGFDETALGSWTLLTGLFVVTQATRSVKATAVVASLEGRTVAHWAQPFAGRVQADEAVPTDGGPYAVAENGRLAGVLAGDARSNGVTARQAMVAWTPDIGVKASDPITTALEVLARKPGGVLVVLDDKGVVRGVLDEAVVRSHLKRR